MNCHTLIMPKRYCVTVQYVQCIASLIDDFLGEKGEGVTDKISLYWRGHGKKCKGGGVMQLFHDSSKNPTSPPPHPTLQKMNGP